MAAKKSKRDIERRRSTAAQRRIDAFHRHLLIRHEKSRKCNADNNHCRTYNRCITRIHNNDV